jgi:hypothetical protein
MDNTYRLKIKIGPHEFEAEGPAHVVQAQFQLFKEMVGSAPAPVPTYPQEEVRPSDFQPVATVSVPDLATLDSSLGKIMKVDNRVVSLTARPKTVGEAILLLLFGQKMMRENDSVTGGEVMDGLVATGGYMLPRVDRMLEQFAKIGDVIVIGMHRSKRYRLTNAGLGRARQIATALLATVA